MTIQILKSRTCSPGIEVPGVHNVGYLHEVLPGEVGLLVSPPGSDGGALSRAVAIDAERVGIHATYLSDEHTRAEMEAAFAKWHVRPRIDELVQGPNFGDWFGLHAAGVSSVLVLHVRPPVDYARWLTNLSHYARTTRRRVWTHVQLARVEERVSLVPWETPVSIVGAMPD